MDHVIPHVTEGLIQICETTPEDPTEFLVSVIRIG
jgi:hypothetical protein